MLFKKTQNIRQAPPPPPENSRQEIAAHLRMADKHIREGNLADAKVELDAVRAIEPNNVYALALEERRQALEKAPRREDETAVEESEALGEKGVQKAPIDEEAIRAEIEQRLRDRVQQEIHGGDSQSRTADCRSLEERARMARSGTGFSDFEP